MYKVIDVVYEDEWKFKCFELVYDSLKIVKIPYNKITDSYWSDSEPLYAYNRIPKSEFDEWFQKLTRRSK